MWKQLEWNAANAWRAGMLRALCVCTCSYILLSTTAILAVETEASPRTAEPATAQTAVGERKKLPLPGDVIGADLAEKADATPDADDKASVVDIGDAQDILP